MSDATKPLAQRITPGPWKVTPVMRPDLDDDPMGQYDVKPAVSKLSQRYFDAEPESDELDDVHDENAANAELIALAPTLLAQRDALLAALQGLMKYYVGDCNSSNVVGEAGIAADQARAAIALAGGGK